MALYQRSVLKKHLSAQDDAKMQDAYNAYRSYFLDATRQENIRNMKEEQFQEGFLRELFVNILGYTINPDAGFNLTTELKNIKDAKKTDGAILKADGAALAVIELKGTDTKDLDKVRDQAFNYKNNQPDCVYVVTSNFEKLRFYMHNAVEHEEFNLFTLSYERFKLLWLFLQKDNLLGGIPAKVKEESLLQEDKITKALYADYSAFKNDLWNNMVQGNPQHDPLLLYKKSQKLLDRFLFIFFSEDKGLLPPNSISVIVEQWQKLKDLDEYKPLYDRFKKYFGYMNDGYKGAKYEIHAYNGGLFKEDELLDGLLIDDELLKKHCLKLTKYDFADEVDTNILGHIFEHSLNDIENVRAQLAGEEVDKSKTKRKKDGVFYTPKYITKYIVDNTVGKLCEEKKAELGIDDEEFAKDRKGRRKETIKKLDAQLKAYREWLLQLTICDPACGSGAFLNQALEFLMAEHRYVDELEAQLFEGSIVFQDVENHILENNIYGVDINEESVEIARLSLWLRTAQKGRKLTSLSSNIKCGNSLIDDPEVAGDLAFNWQNEFPTVFAKGGFDVVIGNPPYVFARGNIEEIDKEYYVRKFKSAQYQVNTYLLFIERTIDIIKEGAAYGLIIPNAWLMVYSGQELRRYILETCTVDEVINLEGYSFEGVNVETIILIAHKEDVKDNDVRILLSHGKEFRFSHSRNQNDFRKNEGLEFRVFANEQSIELTAKIKNDTTELDELVQIKAGLQAYEKNKGNPKQTAQDVIDRPYDYDYQFDEHTYKYLDGKNVGRYNIEWTGAYLRYGEHLASPRTFNLFEDKKIIVREITGKFPRCIIATYSEELFLYNRSNIGIIERPESKVSLKYVLALLNSSLMSYYFMKNTAKSVRKMFPKIILNDLRLFPIKVCSEATQMKFESLVDNTQLKNEELVALVNSTLQLLQSKFDLPKPSTKLQNWPSLDFKCFLAELKKAKVVLGLEAEAEWMNYFNKKKAEANALQSEIDRTDKQIDQMVYELYGLSEEEIAIVEST